MNHEERDLQTWFDQLRDSERRGVPPFEALLMRRRVPLGRRLAVAFAAIVIVVVAGTLNVRRRPPLPIEQLSRWRSPTASLLDVPSSPLMSTAPSLTR